MPFLSPGDLADQGVEPEFWQFNPADRFFTTDPPSYSEKERTHRNVSLILLSPESAVSALWRPKVFINWAQGPDLSGANIEGLCTILLFRCSGVSDSL